MSKRSHDDFYETKEENKRHRHGAKLASNIPDLHSIFHGEVARVQPYGAFVKIPGCRKQGLVHKSQMSTTRVEDPSEMVAMGEMVFCKVISMEEDGEKIALSMKVVNQTTGQDLDPNNVQLSLDERKKRKGHQSEIPKIELGAVFDTTCKKCGGHGHLAQDCFHVKGSKTYDLIPELSDQPTADRSSTADDNLSSSHKKKKHKKEKKHKKSKKKKHKQSHSSSESDSPAHKKKHKHRHKSTDSDSSDDSSPTYKVKHKKHKSHKRHSSGPSEVQKKLLELASYH